MALAALLAGVLIPLGLNPFSQRVAAATPPLPSSAQLIDQRSFNVLDKVLPLSEANATTVCDHQTLALGRRGYLQGIHSCSYGPALPRNPSRPNPSMSTMTSSTRSSGPTRH